MTVTQAAFLGVALAIAAVLLLVGITVMLRRLPMRRFEKRWKAAHDNADHRLTILPSWCTCCPIHDHAQARDAQRVTETGSEVSAEPGRDPNPPETVHAP